MKKKTKHRTTEQLTAPCTSILYIDVARWRPKEESTIQDPNEARVSYKLFIPGSNTTAYFSQFSLEQMVWS